MGFENPHLFEMLAGAEAALARKDYGLLIKRINSRELVNSFADIMDSEYVDGAIVHASVVSKEVAVLLTDTSFPYVVIGMPDFPIAYAGLIPITMSQGKLQRAI